MGYDLERVENRVCELFNIKREDIYSKSREKVKADARGLFCFWAVRELGFGLTELARRLGKTQLGVGYAVIRGEGIAEEHKYQLKD